MENDSTRELSAHSGTADDSSLLGCEALSGPVTQRHGVTHQKISPNGSQELDADTTLGHKMEAITREQTKLHRRLRL